MMRLVFLLVLLIPIITLGQGSIRRVGTVDELERLNPQASAVSGKLTVLLLGRDSIGDFGDPRVIEWLPTNSIAADGACYFDVATSVGTWWAPDCYGASLDPRWFGATIDDDTDDSAAIQSAIDAAGDRSSVRLPVGRFLLSTPLSYKDRIHIRGEGDGSMLAVTSTNGIAFWNGTPDTRLYEVFLEDFAINTGLGARGYAAVTLTNVSYARLERLFVHAYDGLGFQIGVKSWGDSPSSVGGAWSSSMVGCKIYVYPRQGEPAYAFHGDGGPDWGHGPNSWRIIDNYLNAQPVINGGTTNYGTAVVYANNQNGLQLSLNIFEGYYTNSVLLEKGAASSIMGNRFEVGYGTGGTNFAAIKLVNMTNVFVGANMSQGLGDYTKYIRSSGSSYTLFDAASQSPNTIDGDLIIGKTWNVDNVGYLPAVDRFLLLDSTEQLTRLGIGLRTIDSATNNPRAVMTLNANPTNGQSWAGIWHGSTPGSIPFYFYQQNATNLAITASGSGVLGLPTTSAALSVYGNGAFGSAPGVTGGWTDMSEGVWVRTTDLSDKAGFHALVNDGVTNRRIEMVVSRTNSAIRTVSTTDNLPLDLWSGGKNPLSVDNSGVRVKTNMFVSTGSSIVIDGDVISDMTGSGLTVVANELTVDGAYFLDRANHTGYQSYTTITGLGDFAIENYPTMDGNTYGINNGIWTVVSSGSSYSFSDGVTNSGGTISINIEPGSNITFSTNATKITISAVTSSSTNGTPVSVDGGSVLTAANLADTSEINHTASGTNVTSALIDGSISTNRINPTFHGWISGKQDALTFSTGVTNSAGTIRAALAAGANVTFVTNSQTITISATAPASTNSWQIGVDGSVVTAPNLANSPEIDPSASGTNVTMSLVAGSIATNKIDTTFHQWVLSQGGSSVAVDGSGMPAVNLKDGSEIAFSATSTNVTASVVSGSLSTNRANTAFRQWVDNKVLYVHGTEVASPNLIDTGTVEITVTGSNIELDVPDGAITYTKLQNVSATNRVIGLGSTSPGDAVELAVGDGLITSSTDIKLNIEAGSGIELATNGNKRVTITSKGYTPSNDAVANLLLVTTSETTDNNQDTTWRDVTPTARSGMSATIPAGTLLSGSVMKVELSGVMDAAAADWAPQLRMVFDGPTGSDYTITFIMNEPGSTYPSETTTWKAEAFIVVASAGSPATVRQRSFALWADGAMTGSGSLAGYGLMTSGQSSNSLDTAVDNTFKLEYQGVNANMQSFSVTSVVVWML